jgi:dTDP-4-amino-4,6-dideoxygalactose transaminase
MIPMFRPPALDKQMALDLISGALDRGYIGEGPLCGQLEDKLKAFLQLPQRPLYMNSCTSALRLAYHRAGARPGAEVICTPMTCLATATAILETGASIAWADVDPETGNISPESVARLVQPRTVAVAAVDWGGRICDFEQLREVTAGISLVEDAAHAFGATSWSSSAGHRGDFVCWSAQAIKHWTTADGGLLMCPGAALTERARLLRWFGLDRTRGASMRCLQNVPEAGFKMQGNDILASIGLASLVGIEARLARHQAFAQLYGTELEGISYVKLPAADPGSSWWFYSLRVSSPMRFVRFMAERGVEVGQVHARLDTQACFDGARSDRLPGMEEFSAHQVNLPCGSHLSDEDVRTIIDGVRAWGVTADARW